jgi:hypothetical protein
VIGRDGITVKDQRGDLEVTDGIDRSDRRQLRGEG